MRSEWRELELGDVCDLIPGFAFKSKHFGNYPDKVVKIANINPPYVDEHSMVGVDLSHYNTDKLKKYVVHKGDFVFAMTGATIGKMGRIIGRSAYLNQRVLTFSPNQEIILKDFLYYMLLDQAFLPFVLGHVDSQTAQPNISANSIGKFPLILPPIQLQRAIAATLSCLDDKIELNNKINANLEAQAQAIFKSWFVDFEPFQDGEFVDSELGRIPKGWELKALYDFANYVNGAAFKKDEYAIDNTGYPIIKIAELKNGITASTQFCNVEKDEKYYIDDKDILFSWSGNPDTSIDTFIWHMGKAILNQHTFRVVPNANTYCFVYCMLKYLKPLFAKIASNKQTTGLGHVTVKDLKEQLFVYNDDAVKLFCDTANPLIMQIYENHKEKVVLAVLRDSLLPKLLSGEIEVPLVDEL